MASTRSLLRCPLVCSTAVVTTCEVTSLLLTLLLTQRPVSLLHAGASQNLTLLNEKRAGLAGGNLFMTLQTKNRINPFLQSTVNAVPPFKGDNASSGEVASVIPVAQVALDNGKESSEKQPATQTGERTIRNGKRSKLSSVAASLLHSVDKVRRTNPQLTLQGATWSQRSEESHPHGLESGTTWAAAKEMRARSTSTPAVAYSTSQMGSEGPSMACTGQTSWKSSSSTMDCNLPTYGAALPPEGRADSADTGARTSALSSLLALFPEQGEPVSGKHGRDDLALQRTLHTEAEMATTAKADGLRPAQRRAFLPLPNSTSTITSSPVDTERSLMRAAMHGKQVAAGRSPATSSTFVTSQGTFQTARNGTMFPRVTMMTSAPTSPPAPFFSAGNLQGSLTPQRQQYLQNQKFEVQQASLQQQQQQHYAPMGQWDMVQKNSVTSVSQRPPVAQAPSLEDLAMLWHPYVVEKAGVPRSEATSAGFRADWTDQEQAKRAFAEMQPGPPGQRDTPGMAFTEEEETGIHFTAEELQSQLEKLGYNVGRELPATRGLKMMATGLAMGMTGVFPPSAVVGLFALGALRYVSSKRAQAKAAAASSAVPL